MRAGWGTCLACSIAVTALTASPAVGAQAHDPFELIGRVRDEGHRPIAGVEVILNRHEVRARTDTSGLFSLALTSSDSTIAFRKIGYHPLVLSLRPPPPLHDTAVVEMRHSDARLPDIIVSAPALKPLRYAGTAKYDGVFRRRKVGFGTFLTREDIDRRFVMSTPELLQGIPGVRVSIGPPGVQGATQLRFSRCTEPRGVSVFVDGTRLIPQSGAEHPEIEMLTRINPADVEMIEVYRGAGQIPAEYHWDGCAVVAIWTRWGND